MKVKEYAAVNSVIYDNNNYVLLINNSDIEDHALALVSKEKYGLEIDLLDLKDESNNEIIFKLINLFKKDMNKDL